MNPPVASVGVIDEIVPDCLSVFPDPPNRRLIWTLIQKLKDAGKCVVLTTHFLEEADILSDRIVIMTHGQLQASGTPSFLKRHSGTSELSALREILTF